MHRQIAEALDEVSMAALIGPDLSPASEVTDLSEITEVLTIFLFGFAQTHTHTYTHIYTHIHIHRERE